MADAVLEGRQGEQMEDAEEVAPETSEEEEEAAAIEEIADEVKAEIEQATQA